MLVELVDGHVHQAVVVVGQRKDVANERTLDSENISEEKLNDLGHSVSAN